LKRSKLVVKVVILGSGRLERHNYLPVSTRKKVVVIKVKDMKVTRLEKKEAKLVAKGKKAVDEGREKKADRLFGRAAKVENRVIKAKKK
jgi:hypothetical protein